MRRFVKEFSIGPTACWLRLLVGDGLGPPFGTLNLSYRGEFLPIGRHADYTTFVAVNGKPARNLLELQNAVQSGAIHEDIYLLAWSDYELVSPRFDS
jgi:hypothetical protein